MWQTTLKRYFIGILLMPWIWIWGYYLVYSFAIYNLVNLPDISGLEIRLGVSNQNPIDLVLVWIVISICLLINYTLAFSLSKEYKRLESVIFLLTVLEVGLAGVLIFPYIWEYLRLS